LTIVREKEDEVSSIQHLNEGRNINLDSLQSLNRVLQDQVDQMQAAYVREMACKAESISNYRLKADIVMSVRQVQSAAEVGPVTISTGNYRPYPFKSNYRW
jgi:hypothetical protein